MVEIMNRSYAYLASSQLCWSESCCLYFILKLCLSSDQDICCCLRESIFNKMMNNDGINEEIQDYEDEEM
ncbi:hypothetical protein P8452_42055 [Trifolium repens]|nr:hypothetical protein P8452_31693 [Trifolium repens]WJX56392.1 hypothetical protein P8452_42055 [Trifolium repens]